MVSPTAMARTIDTASSAKPLMESARIVRRSPAASIQPITISAVSVVRAALIVNVPTAGASALTIRLVTDHDNADPSAQSAPTVSFIEKGRPSRTRGHHLRISAGYGEVGKATSAQDGPGEGLSHDAGRAAAAGCSGDRAALRPRVQRAAGEEEPVAGRGTTGGERLADHRGAPRVPRGAPSVRVSPSDRRSSSSCRREDRASP